METDEAAAVERALAGDREAFGALVERHQEVAFRAAYLIVRDAQAAEDVAQEAFVRAYRELPRFRVGEPFRPWLLRIVQNPGAERSAGAWAQARAGRAIRLLRTARRTVPGRGGDGER